MKQYHYNVILSSFSSVDIDIKEAKYYYGEDDDEDYIIDNIEGDWGDIFPMVIHKATGDPLPKKIRLRWITPADLKCYELEQSLDTDQMEELWSEQEKSHEDSPFKYVVVGVAPYGEVAIWLRGEDNNVLFQQMKGREVEMNEKEKPFYDRSVGDDKKMAYYLSKEKYQSLMRQYQYRYVPLEEYFNGKKWVKYPNGDKYYEDIEIGYIEDKRVDGTFDFTESETMQRTHTAGMPSRIAVRWTENESKYYAHFWLNSHYTTLFFESFAQKFPDTPIDLMIRLDTRANQYEIAISAKDKFAKAITGTQYIVLKDKQEISRSKFFYQNDGDWYWQ